ncbi:MAG: ORF6N domain-containing protein [Steroidobacteraceae bacterium]
MTGKKSTALVPNEHISQSIIVLRSHKVLLDADLAAMYGVEIRTLLQAVKRHLRRFPDDFMLQLTTDEWASLRSQFVILKTGRGQHRKYRPYAFTEQGVAMLSSILNSERAIAVNIEIMRAFVRMRELLASNKRLAQQLKKLERKVASHDEAIVGILKTIRQLMNPPESRKRSIGFVELQERKKGN